MAKTFKVLLFNLALMLGLIVVLELFFGDWIFRNRISQIGIVRNFHYVRDSSKLYEEGKRVKYTRDAYGLRGDYSALDQIDILTLGGSTTDQRHVSDGKTWQDVMRREFMNEEKKNIAVVNAGVDGQSTAGHIVNFEKWFPHVPNLKSKYVLVYAGLNELYQGIPQRKGYDQIRTNTYTRIWDHIKNRSALYRLFKIIGGMIQAYHYDIVHRRIEFSRLKWTKQPLLANHEDLVKDELNAYRNRLFTLHKKIHSSKAAPIYVTQPSFDYRKLPSGEIFGITMTRTYKNHRMNGVDHYYILRAFNDVMMNFCREVNALCIDMEKELNFGEGDYYDFEHTTANGSLRIGQYLYGQMRHVL